MRLSQAYIPTLKETPAEAEIISHKLLLRAGMIRKLTSGIYTFLPLGLKVLNKVARIVREEMDAAGAQEILMPLVQPGDLWEESGRWGAYGKELLRIKDRHQRDYCLGPTHEEVVTDLVRGEIKSYRQLPVNLYQVQTKFRDEIRPRFGLMRCREFVMKDAYSFDKDEAGAEESYRLMFNAYSAAFTRLGLKFRSVEADSGAIGGSFSHEFMVLAETGEDTIAACLACDYAANLERAEVAVEGAPEGFGLDASAVATVDTPGQHTVDEVCAFLKVGPEKLVKTLLYDADGTSVAALVRGDRELNEIKLKNLLDATELAMASPEQVREWSGAPVGFAGPVGLKVDVMVADAELVGAADMVAGANAADAHVTGLAITAGDLGRAADLRVIAPSDPCPRCGGALDFKKGIEVGHVFKLGTKYSEALDATFLDENGKDRLMVMGCYGIGVSRILAAAIEQNNDGNGIVWPPAIAPFEVVVVALAGKSPEAGAKAGEIYETLKAMGLDAALDDRDERPGVKFKDADLVGCPMQIVVGEKGLKNGIAEAKDRRSGERSEIVLDDFQSAFAKWREQVLGQWSAEQVKR